MKLRYQVVFALMLSGAVFGQEFRGAISGAVTDPAGGTHQPNKPGGRRSS